MRRRGPRRPLRLPVARVSTGICVVPLSGFCSPHPGFRFTLLETDDAKRGWLDLPHAGGGGHGVHRERHQLGEDRIPSPPAARGA